MIRTVENGNDEPQGKSIQVAQGGGVGAIVVERDAGANWLYGFHASTSIIGYDDAHILDAYMGSSRFVHCISVFICLFFLVH